MFEESADTTRIEPMVLCELRVVIFVLAIVGKLILDVYHCAGPETQTGASAL